MIIMTPSDENETRKLLTTGYLYNGPAAVRYPRGTGPNTYVEKELSPLEIGKAKVIKDTGSKTVFLNFGALLDEAIIVSDELNITLIDMRFVKPLDENLLKEYLSDADLFISLEDGAVMGGAGSSVQEFCAENSINIQSKLFGIPDKFIDHASRKEMIEEAGLISKKILESLK
jgi:1-deoxy-D-xylulose-5-phosphate synthase